MTRVPYASAVGGLMYAMICTRPDIAHVVGVMSRYMANPGKEHWKVVQWILRYLKGTFSMQLCYGGSNISLCGYVDSNMVGDLDCRRSTTGYIFTVGGMTVSWISRLQKVVALSTTEAEYVAATEAIKEMIWMSRFMELGKEKSNCKLFSDSQIAIHLAKNSAFHSRTKHIQLRYHFIRQVLEDGQLNLEKIHTSKNPADMLMKPLAKEKLELHSTYVGLQVVSEVNVKIKKTFCPPQIVEGSACLEYIQYIMFPWFKKFKVHFSEENGGILQWGGWEDEEYPSKEELLMVPFFALLFPAVRFFLDVLIFERLGRWLVLGSMKGLSDNEIEDLKKRHKKFKESAWKLLYYFSAESLALAVTYNEPWFTNTRNFWVGPGDQIWPDQKVKTKLKLLYMYAAGFYTYSIAALFFWETRRSDFGVSMSHHVATLILILASYLLRFSRVGSVVLAIHDASDVLLEVSKMFKYSGSTMIPSVCFVLFAISWIVLRLVYFPFWIIWSTSYEVIYSIETKKNKVEETIYYYIFNTLLICLLVLHIYWWVLIYRMFVRQIKARGKISEDVRS
ncbi:hypothetical protein KI387_032569, partial [Taxus chinensis]